MGVGDVSYSIVKTSEILLITVSTGHIQLKLISPFIFPLINDHIWIYDVARICEYIKGSAVERVQSANNGMWDSGMGIMAR